MQWNIVFDFDSPGMFCQKMMRKNYVKEISGVPVFPLIQLYIFFG